MPRYIVERTFADGLAIPATADGARACLGVVENNADAGVTWLHSYVTEDRRKTFCLYDGPSPEAIRQSAARSGLPVDAITPVRVLDPYFHYV
jgi:Nickel responsive protein SCO4226-like